ncbi:MAG: hypothetical protein M3383_00940 [Actinomycetota bacterium]|nr:hypothetical protein [Actinomycetota bacterium]
MIWLRRFLACHCDRVALAAVLATICVALTFEHSGIGQDHMGDVVSMCLAVLDGAAVIALTAGGLTAIRRLRPPRTIEAFQTLSLPPAAVAQASARDGPAVLQVFRR